MKEIFRYKGKHVLYNTGEVEESESAKVLIGDSGKAEKEGELSAEQMGIVLSSMSDNRISDSVKELVQKAEDGGSAQLLTEEQRRIVSGSMSDNRISDSVRELVEKSIS